MPRLRSLEVFVNRAAGADVFASLWAAPWFPQLQELTLTTDQGFGSPGLAPLRAAPLLRRLCIETCHDHRDVPALAAADGRALAAAALPELRELRLHTVGPGFVAGLAAAPWLSGLRVLDLGGGDVRLVGGLAATNGRALAAAPLPSLTQLALTSVDPGFMAACAAAAWLARLTSLTLRSEDCLLGGRRGDSGMPGGWPAAAFTALASLTLCYMPEPPTSEVLRFAALVAAPWFGRLQLLDLQGCPLGSARFSDGAGLRALAAAPLPGLSSLSLSGACLTAEDVSGVLASAPWLASLTRLGLIEASYQFGARGHRALSLLHLPRLQTLTLACNRFDCAGMAALVSAPWLTQLCHLGLTETRWASGHGCRKVCAAVEDDAWVFGRLRRAGCVVATHLVDDEIESSCDE
jgi:hypothetical protein